HHGNIDSDLVAAGMDDLPPRHRSLRGVFEHSWRLLVTPARHTLAHLSVFHGPFSSAAALAVTGNAQAELASLIDNSLLQRSLEGYYEMHSLVRHFAAAQCLALNIDFKSLQLQH